MAKKKSKAKSVAKKSVGRPLALDAAKKAAVLAFISAGGSRSKAAEYVGVAISTIANEGERDVEFLEGLARAESTCYLRQVNKITGCDDWRAAAWFLARKYPDEFSDRLAGESPQGTMTAVRVEYVNGWFGATAGTVAAPMGSLDAPGEIQGIGLRPALGQDGAGTTGDDAGTRPASRRASRRA